MGSIRQIFKRAWDSATEDTDKIFREAMGSGFLGYYEEAVELLERLEYLLGGPSYKKLEVLFYKAAALGELGKTEEAIIEWKKILEIEKKDDVAWHNLGLEYRQLGKPDEALACYNKAIKLSEDYSEKIKDDAMYWIDKGEIHLELKQFKEFEKCVNKALELDPESPDVLNMKTGMLWELGKDEEALKNEEKNVQINPDVWESWNGLGTAFDKVNNSEKALECYEHGIKLDSTVDLLWYNKACTLSKLNKKEEALDSLLVAISLEPENLIEIREEEDFRNIRDTERFKKFLSRPV